MMPSLPLRGALWLSFAAVVVAVFLGLQRPLQDIFTSESHNQTFCYSHGVTAKVSTQTAATCFTVKDGLFVDVFTPKSEPPVEVHQGHAIPGLWDGHGHLYQYGEFLHSVDLFGSSSIEEAKDRLAIYLSNHKDVGTKDDWIRGIGWDQMALGEMPTAAMLENDERFRGLYIMLDRVDVHCTWVSQAVLDLLPEDLPDIPGGEIIRDPGMGVFCDNAMEAVMKLWPKPDDARKTLFLKSAMASLHEYGLVGMHDAGVNPDGLRLYKELVGTDDWTLRVYAMIECEEHNMFCPEKVSAFVDSDGFLSIKSVKLFADGALGSWGSAMIEPYSDRPDTSGSLLVNASTLTSLAKSWSSEGYQVNIHAIGDLANRLAIDAMEAAIIDFCPGRMVSTCQAERRFRIEHSQIIHPHDQARMRSMKIIPSIQPTHATSDMKYAELRLGKKRTVEEAYRMRSLLNLKPILGSDFPVEPPNPFEGIYAAVARRSPHTGKGADGGSDSWYPEEALSLHEALVGFTEGPAHGAFLEGKAGVIQPGAMADWVVLDEPLESLDIEDLRTVKVKETWVGGKRVYARD
ncbi:Putative amidohydrolase YtcJ [Cytospora mali]|uniref:Amidohydrolase YtcJ n=1 Tax=Cytospora mali TaxID=578113 RepID=A0A194V3P6_CYTMA|nr:Putative amidohydrolase YtcJ [Valsa mali var. pyri (nom. inval.)]